LILVDYATENKIAAVKMRAITQTAAENISPMLQYAHSETYLQNAPPSQDYGSASSVYRWEFQSEGANLKYEIEQIHQW
jgi:hypothetical protein